MSDTERLAERLVATAIERDGVIHKGGREGHWSIRAALGDEDATRSKLTDIDGFMTDAGRFVDRSEGNRIAVASGQFACMIRRMLSCDVDWDAKPPKPDRSSLPRRKRLFHP